jgi:hypothetical protein
VINYSQTLGQRSSATTEPLCHRNIIFQRSTENYIFIYVKYTSNAPRGWSSLNVIGVEEHQSSRASKTVVLLKSTLVKAILSKIFTIEYACIRYVQYVESIRMLPGHCSEIQGSQAQNARCDPFKV